MMRTIRQLVLLICVLAFDTALADNLGRLFSTPIERARIDDVRAGKQPTAEVVDAETVDQLMLNGMLTGSNGKRLAWINGAAVDPDAPSSDITLLYDGRARLQWRGGEASRTLKPGQVVDKATGEVFELYERALLAPQAEATAAAEPAEVN